MPEDLPDFLAGYQRGHEIWIYLQPGDYYTRHLLLHEGTHAFMGWFLNGFGSPWYSEGMAELLAINQWQDGKLQLHYQLRDRQRSGVLGPGKNHSTRVRGWYQRCHWMRYSNIPGSLFSRSEILCLVVGRLRVSRQSSNPVRPYLAN